MSHFAHALCASGPQRGTRGPVHSARPAHRSPWRLPPPVLPVCCSARGPLPLLRSAKGAYIRRCGCPPPLPPPQAIGISIWATSESSGEPDQATIRLGNGITLAGLGVQARGWVPELPAGAAPLTSASN